MDPKKLEQAAFVLFRQTINFIGIDRTKKCGLTSLISKEFK